MRGRLALGALVGLVAGACGSGDEGPVAGRCAKFDRHATSCMGHAYEGCDEPCQPECVARGHAAADASAECGELWLAAYDCVLALSCEQFLQWQSWRWDDEPGYPCEQPEQEFRGACPDVPLWPGES